MTNHLADFYAVTMTSLYRITSEQNHSLPVFTKIAARPGSTSTCHVGTRIEGWDKPFIRVWGNCIQLCNGWFESHHSANYVPKLVALFVDEVQARTCLQIQTCAVLDLRWREQTLEVLYKLGESHPIIHILWDTFPSEYVWAPDTC